MKAEGGTSSKSQAPLVKSSLYLVLAIGIALATAALIWFSPRDPPSTIRHGTGVVVVDGLGGEAVGSLSASRHLDNRLPKGGAMTSEGSATGVAPPGEVEALLGASWTGHAYIVGSSATKVAVWAGLRPGDVITGLQGKPVRGQGSLQSAIEVALKERRVCEPN